MLDKAVDEHSGVETLDAVESIHRASVAGNAEVFALAAHFADIYNGDGLDSSGRVLPGMERPVRFGGEGTPLVREFAFEEFGARMGMGPVAVRHYIGDALNTRHRLPRLWARVVALDVKVSYARSVAQATHHLSLAAAARVDAEVAQYADGRISWARFQSLVEAKIIEADPEAAAAREAAEALKQFARAGRSNEAGMKGFYLRSGAGLIARFDATVAYLADALKALGDPDGDDLRRVKACAIMANPTQAVELLAAFATHRANTPAPGAGPDGDPDQPLADNDATEGPDDEPEAGDVPGPGGAVHPLVKPQPFRPDTFDPATWTGWSLDWSRLLPSVTLYLHLSQDTIARDEGGVARWEGEGPISTRYVRDHLAPYHQFIIKPVIDLADQTPVDAYECPASTREAVHLRSPGEVFPFSAHVGRNVDIDHTRRYRHRRRGGPPGQTRLDNLGPLTRRTHRLKTHGAWEVRQPFNGIFIWRDPHGVFYLVDHTGTRKTTPPGHPGHGVDDGRATPTGNHASDLKAQVWEATDTLEYTPTHAA
jgi:hypothetical protein